MSGETMLRQQTFCSELVTKLKCLFSVDLRSLTLFRCALACVILYDLYARSLTFVRDYTDLGALPRAVLIDKFMSAGRISFHLMSGMAWVQVALFLTALFFALMLLIGFRTRLATIVSWVMLMSLQTRNPMILQAGDSFLRMLLFFGMFLPLGACFSIDAVIDRIKNPDKKEKLPRHCFSFATVGVLSQLAFVYWFTGAIKLADNSFQVWWNDASAIYYALSIDQFALPVGSIILNWPLPLLSVLTRAVVVFEIVGPILLFWPIFPSVARLIGILGFIGLQMGFGLCLNLGPFPLVSITAVLPFIPTVFWDKVFSEKRKFFGVSSYVLQFLEGSSFLKRIAKENPYRKLDHGFVMNDAYFSYVGLPRAINLIVAFFITYVFIWNIGVIYPSWQVKNPLRQIGVLLGFEQNWNMFAPPLLVDGWYVIPGQLVNGKQVDLFRGGLPVSWEKPERVARRYRSERDRKYMMNLWRPANKGHRLYYGKYLCRQWNRTHRGEEQLETFKIIFMKEKTLPNRQKPKIEKITAWSHRCFDSYVKTKKSSRQPA